MKFVATFCTCIALICTFGCSPKPTANGSNAPMIQLETLGCRGFCPTYKLLFHQSGMVAYDGIRNMVKPGKDTFMLTASELKKVQKAVAALNIRQYPARIESSVADAPSAILTVWEEGKTAYAVSGSIDRPAPLLAMENLLKDLAEIHGLKVKEGLNPYEAPANQQEILVKFKPEINPGNFLMQFDAIKLRIVRRVSAENLWIIGYNPDQIKEQPLIDLLKGMDGVLEAGSNKK
jgi:hypothetical protein